MVKKQNKKILVWDGIFQGHKYITEQEMEDRKSLQKKMLMQILIAFGIVIIICIIAMWILLTL